MASNQHRTPDGLLAVSAGCLLLSLVIVWVTLHWLAAAMATAAAFLGVELGKVGARWRDERYDD